MTLREARVNFSRAFAELVIHAFYLGFEAAFDEVTERITEKDPTSDHMKHSLHHLGLAGDLILYKDGKYLSDTESYRVLGEWWEKEGRTLRLPLRWGGRFGDGNHFSIEWKGRK